MPPRQPNIPPASPPEEPTTLEHNPWSDAAATLEAAVPAVATALVDALATTPVAPLFRAFIDLYDVAQKKAGFVGGLPEIICYVEPPGSPDQAPDEARARAPSKELTPRPKT